MKAKHQHCLLDSSGEYQTAAATNANVATLAWDVRTSPSNQSTTHKSLSGCHVATVGRLRHSAPKPSLRIKLKYTHEYNVL